MDIVQDEFGKRLVLGADSYVRYGDLVFTVPRSRILTAGSQAELCHLLQVSKDEDKAEVVQSTIEGGKRAWFLDAWSDSAILATGFSTEISVLREEAREQAVGSTNRDLFWAVRSRCFLDYNSNFALVPVADLLDHNCFVQTSSFDMCARNGFSLYAPQAMSPGDQVAFSYGENRTNEDLLVSHGFCCLHNPNDSVKLNLKDRPSSSLQEVALFAANTQPIFTLLRDFSERLEDLQELEALLTECLPPNPEVLCSNAHELCFSQAYWRTKHDIVCANLDFVRNNLQLFRYSTANGVVCGANGFQIPQQ